MHLSTVFLSFGYGQMILQCKSLDQLLVFLSSSPKLPRISVIKSQTITFSPPLSLLTLDGTPSFEIASSNSPQTVSFLLFVAHLR